MKMVETARIAEAVQKLEKDFTEAKARYLTAKAALGEVYAEGGDAAGALAAVSKARDMAQGMLDGLVALDSRLAETSAREENEIRAKVKVERERKTEALSNSLRTVVEKNILVLLKAQGIDADDLAEIGSDLDTYFEPKVSEWAFRWASAETRGLEKPAAPEPRQPLEVPVKTDLGAFGRW